MKLMNKKTILAIDPGTYKSAWVIFDGETVEGGIVANDDMLDVIRGGPESGVLAIEKIESYGMAVGEDTFETCFWSGRFAETWYNAYTGGEVCRIGRKAIKLHLCGSARAKDPNVRQALIDRFGGDAIAIGGAKCAKCKGKGWFGAGRPVCDLCDGSKWLHAPGPLFGVSSHVWAALAVAITFYDSEKTD